MTSDLDSPSPETPTLDTPVSTSGGDAFARDEPTPAFGWTVYAERMNGRFAMVGFVALLLLELFTRQDFFTWLGF